MHKGRHCHCWRTKVLGGTHCKGQGSPETDSPKEHTAVNTAKGVLMKFTLKWRRAWLTKSTKKPARAFVTETWGLCGGLKTPVSVQVMLVSKLAS